MKSIGISDELITEIRNLAKKYDMEKVILFGSRARGDYKAKSDIDIAVKGTEIARFAVDVDEETSTLLKYDVVDMNEKIDNTLLDNISREGIILYEKI